MTEHNRSPNAAGQAAECGAMLRQAREDAGLDIAQVSQSLKVPMRIVSALEAGQWERLGAPVFVRGQLRSYARLLKVDVAPYLDGAEVGAVRPSDIVSHVHTPAYQRLFEATARRAVYVVITVCFFAVPVWLATRGPGPQTTASLDEAPTAPAAGELAPQVQKQQTEQAARRPDPSPLAASMTPPLSSTRDAPVAEASDSAGLRLSFRGDSWVQVIAADGTALEKGVLKAGDVRDFPAGQVQRVVLGNAAAVDVQRAGSTVALDPYRRGNVARFEVSSDGSLVPVQQ
ncbi:helix-turn-helix domain-containing protein [Pseudoxanthomonas composti]|uniref:Helix-turn-helix domain-containing protein n=1 Tax=Pseudoxanthomonas composti TaxID=2137479 RepID=A0A4Q1K0H1_9GAMM|nr:helix-turn-helix domain-containing protein [Pseudoxanthomonas composti]RXR07457.1 helix-turn-helix domain-containing protein [Pseudoxanthomonas composti]